MTKIVHPYSHRLGIIKDWKSGDGVIKIKNALEKILISTGEKNPNLQIEVVEIKNPEANAMVVAQMIAEGIEKRLPYRRVMKQMVEKVMAAKDVKGIRIYLGGRLAGADMARSEEIKRGRIPLQTIRADIDFARHKAHMPYGDLGIKVWIYKGDIFLKNYKN